MTRPTAPPWYVESDNNGQALYVCSRSKDDCGYRICTLELHGFGKAKSVDWANARLIAQAPALLAAMRRILAVEHLPENADQGMEAVFDQATAIARAAIEAVKPRT